MPTGHVPSLACYALRDRTTGNNDMTMRATVWALALRDVSPVAKLVAIYISDNFDESTGRPSPPLSLSTIAEFSCTTVAAVIGGLDDLAHVGVKIENLDATQIRAVLPVKP
jgi:hypothetical protein